MHSSRGGPLLKKDAAAPGIISGDVIVLRSIVTPPHVDPVSRPVLRNALSRRSARLWSHAAHLHCFTSIVLVD